MTREEKLEAIYKEMANKELTLWCKARIYYTNYPNLADKYFWETTKYIEVVSMGNSHFEDWQIVKYKELERSFLEEDCCGFEVFNSIILQNYRACFFRIIWHPVMLGTIFEWYSSSRWFINSQFVMELVDKWTGYDESIDEQSDECVDFVYSLIQK